VVTLGILTFTTLARGYAVDIESINKNLMDGEIDIESMFPHLFRLGLLPFLFDMRYFLESHPNTPYGLKISESPYGQNGNLLSLPFYLIEAWTKTKG